MASKINITIPKYREFKLVVWIFSIRVLVFEIMLFPDIWTSNVLANYSTKMIKLAAL
jgi:hypothetical protein